LHARILELQEENGGFDNCFKLGFAVVDQKEGKDFWYAICQRELEKAKELQPQLFKWIPKEGEEYFQVMQGGEILILRRFDLPDDYYSDRDVFETEELALASLKPKEEKSDRWRAGTGRQYWIVNLEGEVVIMYDHRECISNQHYEEGNYFQTKGEALTFIAANGRGNTFMFGAPKVYPLHLMEPKPFTPKYGEGYYYVAFGNVESGTHQGSRLSLAVPLYRTREEAEATRNEDKLKEDQKDRFAVQQGIQNGMEDAFGHIFNRAMSATYTEEIKGLSHNYVWHDESRDISDSAIRALTSRLPSADNYGYTPSDGEPELELDPPVKVYPSSLFTSTSPLVGLPAMQDGWLK